jgi:GT2 family glycosyltransferase
VTTVEPAGPEALLRLASGLQAQPYPHWTIAAVSSPEIAQTFKPVAGALGKQIITMWPGAAASDVAKDLSDDDFIVPVAAGDLVPAYAVAALAEAVKQYPGTDIFYGDEEFIDGKGRHTAPQLRPDWSPVLCSALPESPLGATIFIRAQTLRRFAPGLAAASLVQAPYAAARSAICQQASVSHIRRVMRTRAGTPAAQSSCRRKPLAKGASSIAGRAVPPCATIIIPTRDRFDLLESCVESLRRNRLPHDIEVIVIDNGSVQKAAQRFLASLAKDGRFRVVSHPGAFNFSKMCNDAAADAKSETLIFLNNDTEIIDDSWLEPLLYWTQQPGIGAVGAKLLYPNGRVQHAGVVLGIDGRAGHFERLLKKNDPGYFGRLCVPHEVSSVTAACLAVDKRKFDAVGGFDAVNLPVELNDIDLCLRLWERGWKSICAADCVLIHRESASRGITLRANEVYGSERRYFRMRWMHRLRDDLYFHPALSLDSLAPALG